MRLGPSSDAQKDPARDFPYLSPLLPLATNFGLSLGGHFRGITLLLRASRGLNRYRNVSFQIPRRLFLPLLPMTSQPSFSSRHFAPQIEDWKFSLPELDGYSPSPVLLSVIRFLIHCFLCFIIA